MTIQVGKSYLAKLNGLLTELKVEKRTKASNFFVVTACSSFWLTFWQIYRIVVEEL